MKRFHQHIASLDEAKATPCGRCGTTHVAPKDGGKCPAVKNEAMTQAERDKFAQSVGDRYRAKLRSDKVSSMSRKRANAKESVELDEAKGTDVKKFVRGMRVAKTHNPDMKGTVIKGGDNLKKGVEVEWDSGKTTVASGQYLMSIKKSS